MRKNAKFYRNALCGLFAAFALGGFQVAHAGYAQLQTPSGFGGTSGNWTYAAAANDKVYGKVVHQAGALTANVGGQAVKMPAAYRLAANAPRIAAAAVYLHPGVRTAVTVAGWLIAAKLVWDEANQRWARLEDTVDKIGYLWQNPFSNEKFSSPFEACNAGWPGAVAGVLKLSDASYGCVTANGGVLGRVNRIQTITKGCLESTALTVGGCIGARVEQPTFVEDLAKAPMPSTVPLELPYPTPLPIEQPSPWINPSPGENPQSQPLRVPTGQPVPIPNTDPQKWRQPYVDIVPAPTPDNPWRVDIKPGETTSTDPNPVENPTPDAEDKPTPEEDKSLCEKHPEILACQKPELDTPDGEIPKESKTVTYAEEGGFGGGSCPGNIYSNVGGKSIMVYNWSETCGVVSTYLRPIILLLGAMGALFILIPGRDS